jgi:hypothetical protein
MLAGRASAGLLVCWQLQAAELSSWSWHQLLQAVNVLWPKAH